MRQINLRFVRLLGMALFVIALALLILTLNGCSSDNPVGVHGEKLVVPSKFYGTYGTTNVMLTVTQSGVAYEVNGFAPAFYNNVVAVSGDSFTAEGGAGTLTLTIASSSNWGTLLINGQSYQIMRQHSIN